MKPNISVLPDFESDDAILTHALFHRVSKLGAIGISLKLALAGEGLTCEEYEEQLKAYPELATIQAKAKCEFLELCIHTLLSAKDPSANIRWLLERIYPDIFGDPRRKLSK
jgi:hypothetical protein